METSYKKIFYAGISYKEYPQKGQKLKKTGLPLKKLNREFPYLLGGRRKTGKLKIYFSLLPEYAGKTLLGGKPRLWKPEQAERLIYEAGEKASADQGCREQIIAADFRGYCGYTEPLPLELWAVCLYQQRPFDSICVSFPKEAGEGELWRLAELMGPYFPRMKRVACKGPASSLSDQLEDYLYGEFGIVMTGIENLPAGTLCIDFGQEESSGEISRPDHKKVKYINHFETLKFLDTAVKNGYNTKVN